MDIPAEMRYTTLTGGGSSVWVRVLDWRLTRALSSFRGRHVVITSQY